MIKIIGLGPGDPKAITIGAIEELKLESNIFFRTKIHPTVDFINDIGIKYETYDYLYEEATSFDEVYDKIALDLINRHKEIGDLIYAVPGHPLVAEKSVSNLIHRCKEGGIKYKVIPAVSFIDAIMERLEIDPIEGIKVIDAFDISNQILDKRIGTIVTQVYNGFIASEVKIRLSEFYNDESEIIYCRAVGIEGQERIVKIPLYELDMQEDIDYLTSIYIPKDLKNKKDIYDLIGVVDTLRGENGCPWDKVQTHQSIKNGIIEESYEVLDAIEKDDYDGLIEELGDVLLQVVFHASIEKEDGYFNLTDIIEGICNKLVFRHPHVFGDLKVEGTEVVLENWDQLKKKEKEYTSVSDELNGVAKALPSLIRAKKVQAKARKVGFDLESVEESFNKVKEELNEVIDVYNSGNVERIREEVGDLIFACVNIARFLDVDGEEALNKTTNKFIKRIEFIEGESKNKEINMKDMTLQEMNYFWEESKKLEK